MKKYQYKKAVKTKRQQNLKSKSIPKKQKPSELRS